MSSPSSKRNEKMCRERTKSAGAKFFDFFSERVSDFSLKSRAIGPSDSFRPRSKMVLCNKGFVWAPILGSFDKLREVGVLSYLSYTLFTCFVND